jgi:hypothetical protein
MSAPARVLLQANCKETARVDLLMWLPRGIRPDPPEREKGVSMLRYEPPTLSEVGDFAQVTLGRPNWGFEADWSCVMLC